MDLGMNYSDVAVSIWKRFDIKSRHWSYSTILAMNGMARLSKIINDPEMRAEVAECLKEYLNGEADDVWGAYGKNIYRYGGNASAFMLVRGYLPEAKDTLVHAAEMLCTEQPRNKDGLFEMPRRPWHGFIWIDTVFGVCPALLWIGKAAGRQDFIEESVKQMLGHHRALFDPSCGLYFQAYNAKGDEKFTPAHWSRGVGWGLFALSEMLYDLPKDHKDYPELLKAYRDVLEGCYRSVDQKAWLWHQAMEDPGSYIETSGSALICYAISRGLKNGSIAAEDKERFLVLYRKALRALFGYIAYDGSIFNTCMSCLAPGKNGTVAEYAAQPWILNDDHAAGPMIMALSQAQTMNIIKVIPSLNELLKG